MRVFSSPIEVWSFLNSVNQTHQRVLEVREVKSSFLVQFFSKHMPQGSHLFHMLLELKHRWYLGNQDIGQFLREKVWTQFYKPTTQSLCAKYFK